MPRTGLRLDLEYLRGVAIIAVVLIHAVDPAVITGRAGALLLPYLALDVLAHVAVPLFVAVSGYVLMARHPPPVAAGPFVAHRLGLLLPPYLVVSAAVLLAGVLAGGPVPSPLEVLVRLLTGTAAFHLWFVPLAVELALLYPWLAPPVRRAAIRGTVAPWLVLLLPCSSAYFLGKALLFLAPLDWAVQAGLLQGLSFAGYLVFFVAGMAAGARPQAFDALLVRPALPRALALVLVALLLGVARFQAAAEPSPVLLGLAALSFLVEPAAYLLGAGLLVRAARDPRIARHARLLSPLAWLGGASYGIYLVHGGLVGLVIEALSGAGIAMDSLLYLPLVVGSLLALSAAVVGVAARLPGGRRWSGTGFGRGA